MASWTRVNAVPISLQSNSRTPKPMIYSSTLHDPANGPQNRDRHLADSLTIAKNRTMQHRGAVERLIKIESESKRGLDECSVRLQAAQIEYDNTLKQHTLATSAHARAAAALDESLAKESSLTQEVQELEKAKVLQARKQLILNPKDFEIEALARTAEHNAAKMTRIIQGNATRAMQRDIKAQFFDSLIGANDHEWTELIHSVMEKRKSLGYNDDAVKHGVDDTVNDAVDDAVDEGFKAVHVKKERDEAEESADPDWVNHGQHFTISDDVTESYEAPKTKASGRSRSPVSEIFLQWP